jgi:hypothetical protein
VLEALDVHRVHPEVREDISHAADVAAAWASQRPPMPAIAEGVAQRSRVSRHQYPRPFNLSDGAFVGCTPTLRARAEVCNTALEAVRASGEDVSPNLRLEFLRIRAALRSHRDVLRRGRCTGAARRARGAVSPSAESAI